MIRAQRSKFPCHSTTLRQVDGNHVIFQCGSSFELKQDSSQLLAEETKGLPPKGIGIVLDPCCDC